MTEITCATCNEPWEYYYLINEADEEDFEFSPPGSKNIVACPACPKPTPLRDRLRKENTVEAPHGEVNRADARRELAQLLGDDHDGFAALCEDFGL